MPTVDRYLPLHPHQSDADRRTAATKAAQQFEALFVRTMVQTLRQSAQVGTEDGGMFGSGPGADSYADWFDDNLSTQIGKGGKVGIADKLLHDWERWGTIKPATPPAPSPFAKKEPGFLHPRGGKVDVAS